MEIKKNGTKPKGERFYPDIGDNLDLPEDKRAWLDCVRITGRELMGLNNKLERKIVGAGKKAAAKSLQLEKEKRLRLVKEKVIALGNWTVTEEDDSKTEVTDFELLLGLIAEHWSNAAEAANFVDQVYGFIVGDSTLGGELAGESS